jgi:hypothetical protein
MITFKEFLELAESSSPERGRRRLASRGPGENTWDRIDARRSISDKVALKKAGFKRPASGKDSVGDESTRSSHHFTTVDTDANQSDFAIQNTPHKNLGTGKFVTKRGGKANKVTPTSKRVSRLKTLRKQLGGDRTSKPVHNVAVYSDDDHRKNDPDKLPQRQTSFKKELRGGKDALKHAGAKPGDKVAFEPSALMGGENPKKGKQKRDSIYTRQFKAKMNKKTGITIGTMRG